MCKAYVTISKGIEEVDTFILPGPTKEGLAADLTGLLAKYPCENEFAFTIYDSPHGLQMPIESRRGYISDIIADMCALRA